MSGFEIAGVILGILPLVISAIEDYENIVAPITTYRKYSKALKTFMIELNVQRDIFQNECIWILSPFVDGHDLEDMLKDPSHHLRQSLRTNRDLDRSVSDRFGASYRQILDILQLIKSSLDEIYEETKDFPQGLTKPADSADLKAWHRHVSQKMKLAFRKEALNEKVDQLRHRNQAFRALSEQIIRYNAYKWAPMQTQWDEQSSDNTLKKIQKLRTASQTLYHGLENIWTCQKHLDHSTNLRLCLSISELFADTGSKISFDLTLTYGDLERPESNPAVPIMLAVESAVEDSKRTSSDILSIRFDPLPLPNATENTSKIKRQNSLPVSKESRRLRLRRALGVLRGGDGNVQTSPWEAKTQNMKKATFAAMDLPSRPHPKKSDEPDLLDLGSVPNLCTCISDLSEHKFIVDKTCIGFFKGRDQGRYFVYSSPAASTPFSGAITLSNLIANKQRAADLPKPGKWRLAGALSMATLLYHSTPWLQATWKSDDVLFFNFNGSDRAQILDSPYLQPLSRKKLEKSIPSTRSRWSKNELIHRLGIMLLELEFEDSLTNLIQRSSREASLPASMLAADPLLLIKHRAGERLGTLYGRIVRMCLDCDFGLGLDDYPLENPNVQKIFYSNIVRQFQERMPDYARIWNDDQ